MNNAPVELRPRPRLRPLARALALSLAGTLLLWVPALRWRIDRWAGDAAEAGHATTGDFLRALVYLGALALLTLGWREATRRRHSLGSVLAMGLVVHLAAWIVPPFLSLDPLAYAATGRAMARYHQSPFRPLVETLPAGDPYLERLPAVWQHIGSAYWPAWNAISSTFARIGGDAIELQIRLFQLVGLLAMLGTAWLTGVAVRVIRPREAGRAAALVLFCPLAVIEATLSGHNDALLALSAAAFAVAVVRGWRGASALALTAGIAVKASGLLLAVMRSAQLLCERLPFRVTARHALAFGLMCVGSSILFVVLFSDHLPIVQLLSTQIGSSEAMPHCTRSIECLPRAILYWGLHWKRAAWLVGLGFRVAGGLWLFFIAWRAEQDDARATLSWAATGLFVYYLFLHGFSQSWYLLSLLPLLPHAHPRLVPAMRAFVVSSLAYYAVRLPLANDLTPSVVAMKELIEGLAVLGAPTVLLLRSRTLRAAAPAEELRAVA